MAFTDDQVAEHVSDIVFDPLAAPEVDCLLCQRASELGLWDRYGGGDPFAPDAEDDR